MRFRPPKISTLCGRLQQSLQLAVLLFVAWQGPIPWCHCHGGLATASTASNPWMARHLRTHHASDEACCGCFGWHFHMFSREGEEEGRTTRSEEPLPPTNSCDVVSLAGSAPLLHWQASCLSVCSSKVSVEAAADLSRSDGHFYGAFAPSLALPMRFSVMRA